MTKPRQQQVCLEATAFYHCVSRCVRRAFLCGRDDYSGRCFEHRRQWVVDRLKALAGIFAIDICAYAVMSNHYHVVLHVDKRRAQGWDDAEVMRRWTQMFSGPSLVQRYQAGEALCAAERDVVSTIVATWRARLFDVSWFMRCLNESLARAANEEDKCTGRFWEGRYKSQALLDEGALMTCMSYVDLNPIRAGMATTPEESEFTSIRERIERYHNADQLPTGDQPDGAEPAPPALFPFIGNERADQPPGITFSFSDYLQLVDWTGRAVRDEKRGAIPSDIAPILARLGIAQDAWLDTVTHFGKRFHRAAGPLERIAGLCQQLGQRWLRGQSAASELFVRPAVSAGSV